MLTKWNGILIDLNDISYVTNIKMEHSDSFLFTIVFKGNGHELGITYDKEEELKKKLESLEEKIISTEYLKKLAEQHII